MISEQGLKERIHLVAKEKGIPFNIAWKQLLFERFLSRLSISDAMENFIFKGGFLLSYLMKIGRETTDLDFLVQRVDVRKDQIEEIFQKVCSIFVDDGFVFSFKKIEVLSQPHMDYEGFRVHLKVKFGHMIDAVLIDIGVGDIVTPKQQLIHLTACKGKPIFEKEIHLYAYPLDTVFAEKLETILSKGSQNSRMKDYHDIFLMQRQRELLDIKKLREAIQRTFENRGTSLRKIQFDLKGMETIQGYWKFHCQDLGVIAEELGIPQEVKQVIEEINLFLDEGLLQ